MIFIIGANGFAGSAFVRYCIKNSLLYASINRSNYADYIGKDCELLINAAGNSSKRLSISEPLMDFDKNVRETFLSILDFNYKRYVYLSSIDVYNDCSNPQNNAETAVVNPALLSRYGLNKYMGELLVRKYTRNHLIIRLGGMVGPGLRKNAVFDILYGDRLFVHKESAYQYIHTDEVAGIVIYLARNFAGGETINLCGDGVVRIQQIMDWAGKNIANDDLPQEYYEINIEKLKSIMATPISESAIKQYLHESKENMPNE
jgi:nucleoside-diphosphate-sugar epimerase